MKMLNTHLDEQCAKYKAPPTVLEQYAGCGGMMIPTVS